jgi:hypothetical protein
MCRQNRQCFKQNLGNKNIVPNVVAPVNFISQVGEKKVKKNWEGSEDDLQVLYNTALLNVILICFVINIVIIFSKFYEFC